MATQFPSVRSVCTGLALVAMGALLASAWPEAEAAKAPTVVCEHIQQSATQVNAEARATFMNEQLSQGRGRFQSVRGISTVVCAY